MIRGIAGDGWGRHRPQWYRTGPGAALLRIRNPAFGRADALASRDRSGSLRAIRSTRRCHGFVRKCEKCGNVDARQDVVVCGRGRGPGCLPEVDLPDVRLDRVRPGRGVRGDRRPPTALPLMPVRPRSGGRRFIAVSGGLSVRPGPCPGPIAHSSTCGDPLLNVTQDARHWYQDQPSRSPSSSA